MMFRKLKIAISRWWWNVRHPPAIVISRSGQLTARPKVHVSAHGNMGMQEIYTWDANEQGEACATMYGKGLAHIFGVKIIDEREL